MYKKAAHAHIDTSQAERFLASDQDFDVVLDCFNSSISQSNLIQYIFEKIIDSLQKRNKLILIHDTYVVTFSLFEFEPAPGPATT